MSHLTMTPFLRRVLKADAWISVAAGVAMSLGASVLQDVLHLPSSLLVAAGGALFPWAGFLLWLAAKAVVPSAAVWAVIALNALWFADSAWVSLGGAFQPNALGHAFIAAQAFAVLVLAELEFMGLKRATQPALSSRG
ncbi:hypothetical protein [Piscinibacter terrae]|uniref:hypothetical protein n=1 Tax=Piscinibacter terrae TaxID=2496871 RepID=UPI001F2A029E|nr:hypothetical protein [Albitalea terrae]